MHTLPKAELIAAMNACLRDLEHLELLSPDEPEILNLRRALKERIKRLERKQAESVKSIRARYRQDA